MMQTEKMMTGLPFVALGAFASYLGFWLTDPGHQAHALPIVFALGMAATGLAMASRTGKRLAHPDAHHRAAFTGRLDGAAFTGRLEMRAASAPRAPERSIESERHGDAALLGHEMKNYLCTLKGNARLLRQRAKGNDSDIIDRIDRVVEKLESFTHTLSSASVATTSGLLWHQSPGDIAKACVKVHFHREIQGFHWDVRPGAPTMLGDPDRMEQVFLNLYANAREAGASRVTTSVRSEGDRLQVCIEDDGHGCASEDLERIFEPFFTTRQGPARRGLGMFIVQSIVENHGGHIKVKTKNGSGAGKHGLIFVLDFPASLPPTLENRDLKPVPFAAEKSSHHWLLALPEPI